MPALVLYLIMGGVALAVLLTFAIVARVLSDGGWTLKDALSEPTAAALTSGGGSSSRLIAFMGMVVILALFLGVGLVSLWLFGTGQPINLDPFQNYFLAGAGLFVPYVFNQLRNIGK